MRKKRLPFSKLAVCILISVLTLCFTSQSGSNGFLEPSIAAAADSAVGLTRDNPGIKKAIEVQNRNRERLMTIPGVVGIGTGVSASGQPVIRVFTERAGVPNIPQKLEEIPLSIKVTGMFVAYSDPTDRFPRPVPIGVSTGHPDITAGTLGARVIDGDGNVYALSNNHVYANSNEAFIGDNALQPGTYDGGVDPDDKIGELCDYEPIDFWVLGSNTMDAAIACTTENEVGNATLPEGYGTPNSKIFGDSDSDGEFDNKFDLLLQPVQKFGRTTALTHGEVTEVNVTSAVCYAYCDNIWLAEYAWFDDQITIEGLGGVAFSMGGDSGSLIVTDDGNKNPIGLLFAGSSTNTLANRIDLVLNRFNVSIDDSQGTGPAEVCDNGTDDDGDGDIDCYDTDCENECAALYCFKGRLDGRCHPRKEGEFCPDCF